MTRNNISKDEDKAFLTEFKRVMSRIYNLATKFGNNVYSLSSENELTNILEEIDDFVLTKINGDELD